MCRIEKPRLASTGSAATDVRTDSMKARMAGRLKETTGATATGGRLPSAAGGVAAPAASACRAVARASKRKPAAPRFSAKRLPAATTTTGCL